MFPSEFCKFYGICQYAPDGFAGINDCAGERRIAIFQQAMNFGEQLFVILSKLRDRQAASAFIVCSEAVEQIVDLILQCEFGKYANRRRIFQTLFECIDGQRNGR